jgi:hypothetical protein
VSSTVIDALIVTLGLDASNFKKGRETAEHETSETARKAKLNADAITKSLTEVGRAIAGLFLEFETATGFAKWLGGLNAGEAALGRTAANIGMSAHELNKWGDAVTLAGGSAQDAQSAFSQLTEDFQKMNTTGEQSQLLQFLRARGVNIRDSNGALRDQGEIFEELADKTAQYGRQYQTAMFKQAGLSQGYINYLVQSKALREDQLRLAEKNNGVTEDSVREAQRLQEYWRDIGLQIEAAGQKILSVVTPAVRTALDYAQQLISSFKDSGGLDRMAQTFRIIAGLAEAITNSVKFWSGGVQNSAFGKYNDFMFKQYGKILDFFDPGVKPSAAPSSSPAVPQVAPDTGLSDTYRNHNPGNLRPYNPATQPVDSRGIRKFGSDAEGKKALEDDLRAKLHEGLTSITKLISKYAPPNENNTAAYIADVAQRLHKDKDATLTDADIQMLARAITIHEDAKIKTAKNGGNVGGGGNATTVQIDAMHVHSASADPRAVAEQVPAAIQRKLVVTQADTGQA